MRLAAISLLVVASVAAQEQPLPANKPLSDQYVSSCLLTISMVTVGGHRYVAHHVAVAGAIYVIYRVGKDPLDDLPMNGRFWGRVEGEDVVIGDKVIGKYRYHILRSGSMQTVMYTEGTT